MVLRHPSKTSLVLVLSALLFLQMGSSTASAQRNWATGDWGGGTPGWFDARAEGDYGASGLPLADLTVTIPYRNLIFIKESDGRYRAGYRIRVVQYDQHHRDVRLKEYDGAVVVADYDSTRDTTPLKRMVQFPLWLPSSAEKTKDKEAGQIYLTVRVELEHSHRWGQRDLSIGMPRISSRRLALGDVMVYRAQSPQLTAPPWDVLVLSGEGIDESRFARAPGRIFDLSSGTPYLLVRVYDLRQPASRDSNEVEVEAFAGDSSEPRWKKMISVPGGRKENEVLLRIPPSALARGTNRLRLRLGDDVRDIKVENFGLDPTSDRQWKANLEVIEELASKEEMKELKNAPPQSRAALWMEFWRRRDPDPQTPENPRLSEHVKRVSYAREHFRDGGRDGALSDRGRVYVELGPPDSIESQTMLQNSSAEFELWHYLEQGVVYYFRDDDGLGHWRLVWRQEN